MLALNDRQNDIVNLARTVGPALAGFVIARLGGVQVVFALNAASVGYELLALTALAKA